MFADRRDAGRRLAVLVREAVPPSEAPVVLGLPRGGVPVAAEVAAALGAPLDVFVVRKLGVPGQEELAMGAIASGGVRVLNTEVDAPQDVVAEVQRREQAELERRERRYRGDRPAPDVAGRTVVVVDDGVATGSTARVAAEVTRLRGARRIVLAVPVGPPDVAERFASVVDEVVCLVRPRGFRAVGAAYDSFEATSDEEVEEILQAASPPGAPAP